MFGSEVLEKAIKGRPPGGEVPVELVSEASEVVTA